MRPVILTLSAAGYSAWILLNRLQWTTNAKLDVKLSSGASLTYSVQFTDTDLYATTTNFSISRTTTTATVTQTNHGLSVGDWTQILNAGAPLSGEYQVATVADADTFTYTVANSGVSTSAAGATLQKGRVFTHPVLASLTASSYSDLMAPATAVRLYIPTFSSGQASLTILQGN